MKPLIKLESETEEGNHIQVDCDPIDKKLFISMENLNTESVNVICLSYEQIDLLTDKFIEWLDKDKI